jgi:hypothetical protein
MRVAVVCPPDDPVNPGAHFAFRLGRVEDGVHNHLLHTGETIPMDDFMAGLVEQAKAEFPNAEVRVEVLVEDGGPEKGKWVTEDEYDPDQHVRVGRGQIRSAEFTAASESKGG